MSASCRMSTWLSTFSDECLRWPMNSFTNYSTSATDCSQPATNFSLRLQHLRLYGLLRQVPLRSLASTFLPLGWPNSVSQQDQVLRPLWSVLRCRRSCRRLMRLFLPALSLHCLSWLRTDDHQCPSLCFSPLLASILGVIRLFLASAWSQSEFSSPPSLFFFSRASTGLQLSWSPLPWPSLLL